MGWHTWAHLAHLERVRNTGVLDALTWLFFGTLGAEKVHRIVGTRAGYIRDRQAVTHGDEDDSSHQRLRLGSLPLRTNEDVRFRPKARMRVGGRSCVYAHESRVIMKH